MMWVFVKKDSETVEYQKLDTTRHCEHWSGKAMRYVGYASWFLSALKMPVRIWYR